MNVHMASRRWAEALRRDNHVHVKRRLVVIEKCLLKQFAGCSIADPRDSFSRRICNHTTPNGCKGVEPFFVHVFKSLLLYQLSYSPKKAGEEGVEPTTYRLTLCMVSLGDMRAPFTEHSEPMHPLFCRGEGTKERCLSSACFLPSSRSKVTP